MLVVLGKSDFDHGIVFVGAEDDADCLRLVLCAFELVEVVGVHLHLTQILVGQLAELQVNENEAGEKTIVEDEINVEMVTLQRQALLTSDETESLCPSLKGSPPDDR